MKFQPENFYHVYNQGNDRQPIFLCEDDYQTFLNYCIKLVLPVSDMIAYSLMPNHFHFQLSASDKCYQEIKQGDLILDPLTNALRKLLSGYARIFNSRYGRSGNLFRQRTKAKCLTDEDISASNYSTLDYCSTCFYYIHSNAVVAGLVSRPEDWKWSSYPEYAGLVQRKICNKELAYKFCGYSDLDFSLTVPKDVELLNRFKKTIH